MVPDDRADKSWFLAWPPVKRSSAMFAYTPRHRGFTLIELLMTLCLLSVLLALGMPAYGGLTARARGRSAADTLQVSLNEARMAAISRGAHVVACPSEDLLQCDRTTQWQHGWLLFADNDHDGERSQSEPVLQAMQAQPQGVAIVSTNGRPHVVFKPDGRADGSNLTFTACDRSTGPGAAISLVINMAGRVRVAKASAEAAAHCMQAAG
jgi:type IV fimbrial biogenesis protein FimT